MFKLVKYELKGYSKELIIIIGALILANILLFTRLNIWDERAIGICSMLITFTASITVFAWNIRLFSRDVNEDTGYLLFTLPQNGYFIVGAKLLTSIVQWVIVGLLSGLFNYIWIQEVLKLTDVLGFIKSMNILFVIFGTLFIIVEYVGFLVIVYLSITLGKVAIKNKKFGKLGAFGIFILLTIVLGKLSDLLMKVFPQTMNIQLFSRPLNGFMAMPFPLNISMVVFDTVILIVGFLATSYLIENKLDL